MEEILRISNLSASYGHNIILKNINLSLKKGEILCIVGASGSGKSTLIKSILKVTEQSFRVKSGEIKYKNENILNLRTKQLRKIRGKQIGMIFQNFENYLCPVMKIGQQIYEASREHCKKERAVVYDEMSKIFETFGLENPEQVLNSYPFELSGGMNQRVGIAMTLQLEPDLILADEPTSALDVTVQKKVINQLLEINKKTNTSIILVTHNISLARIMGDKIAVMCDGEFVEYGDKEQILNNPQNEYTKKLLESVPVLGGNR